MLKSAGEFPGGGRQQTVEPYESSRMKASLEKAPRWLFPGLCLLLAGCGGNTMIYQ
jgi:hypothetical protein